MSKWKRIVKRSIDLVGSVGGFLVISPFFLFIAILIKITSKGPVFFKQERLGKNGKVFKIIKFRTMVVNAETLGSGLYVFSETDKRITGIGRVLRKTSLDELPQLLNIIKGDMSLVGPRPPVTKHPYPYEDYGKEQKIRFLVKPGMTGLAQVTVRNSVSWDERIKYDVQYVQNYSLIMDIRILLRTVLKLFVRENLYLKDEAEPCAAEVKNEHNHP